MYVTVTHVMNIAGSNVIMYSLRLRASHTVTVQSVKTDST